MLATPRTTDDLNLLGAEITFGKTHIGQVLGVIRDPISQRVHRVLTRYGAAGRQVAVPIEWVVLRTGTRLDLGVGARSLDDLAAYG